jgi:hypothetical protein
MRRSLGIGPVIGVMLAVACLAGAPPAAATIVYIH